ncbi:PRC-barrel domain-containing protein [Radiobacillus sp. PE A8.2]|uniref:PRC-barrel domain-containing protein n=1 Tax=Radiobacillus sp. PE A8.2 TaxID=3380349 RepID=UPI00388D328C
MRLKGGQFIYYLASTIERLNVQASDEELGGVKDLYFDDQHWTIRYLVADTRKWLPGKKVLLSPIGFDHVDMNNSTVNVLASKETVKNAPHKSNDEPVSKQVEIDLATYYGWPTYWNGLGPWRGFDNPYALANAERDGLLDDNDVEKEYDFHLRSSNEIKGDVFGYSIEAEDGKIGHVSDFVVDDANWKITYFVVETKNILVGKFVLIATDWIKDINWDEKKVVVDLTKEQVKQGADFNPNEPITRAYEDNLYSTFDKPKYWE